MAELSLIPPPEYAHQSNDDKCVYMSCGRMIEAGEVAVNGLKVLTPALNVGPNDLVRVKVGDKSVIIAHTF